MTERTAERCETCPKCNMELSTFKTVDTMMFAVCSDCEVFWFYCEVADENKRNREELNGYTAYAPTSFKSDGTGDWGFIPPGAESLEEVAAFSANCVLA